MTEQDMEQFWDRTVDIELDEDTATQLLTLMGAMFREGVVRRDGDKLIGRTTGDDITLGRDDQWLVRVIEEAVEP